MKHRFGFIALLFIVPLLLLGQESILRLKPYDGTTGSFLNTQIAADTTANKGIPANRVYLMQRGGAYLANASFRINNGHTLRMRANDSANVGRPVIYLYPTGSGTNPQRPPGNLFELRGNLEMRGIIVTGYFEPIDTNLNNLQGALISLPTTGAGGSINLDDCIFSNTNGNHIRTDGAVKNFTMKNCIFANMGYLGTSNLGAGKGIDFRDVSVDTVIMENNTFVNWQDRILRHYNFSNPLAGTGPIKYLRVNHNTMVNGMSYHGLFSLGSMGKTAIITNNLLLDPVTLGNDTDAVRQAEFLTSGEKDQYGGPRMNWIFTTPNDTTKWVIANNYYAISDSGQAFYNQFKTVGVTGEGAPLTWHINSKLGADSVKAFMKLANFKLTNTPMVMNTLNRWYRDINGGNKSKNTPSVKWNKSFDFDRRGWKYFEDTLNCSYVTSSAAYTAAKGGYPVGDLNWFPTRLASWLKDPVSGVEQITTVPTSFALQQNFPNPFNPSTRIVYSIMKSSQVKLEVFDVLGRQVTTLVNEAQQPGEYAVNFDGAGLTSGFYIYKLSTAEQSVSKKMMFLK